MIKKDNKKFRLQTSDFAITYSQSTLNKEKIFNHLKDLLSSNNKKIIYLLIAQENHQDHKGVHHHVFLQLSKVFNITNSRFFDIDKNHPKFERCRDIKSYIDYCKKEDVNFIEEGIPNLRRKYVRQNQKEEYKQLIYDEVDRLRKLFEENEELQWEDIAEQLDKFIYETDRDFYYEKPNFVPDILNRYFRRKRKNPQSIYSWESFKITNELKNIINFIKTYHLTKRPKSLVIESESRFGKSEAMIALLNHLGISFNYFQFEVDFSKENYCDRCTVNLIDDISLFYLREKNLTKALIGGQSNALVNSKYLRIRKIRGNTLNIFLCNADNSFYKFCETNKDLKREDYKYIKTNCEFIFLTQPLYYISNKK